jgi:hypothetical protein
MSPSENHELSTKTDTYSLGFGEGWRTARGFDGEPECWDRMLDRAAEEMASWSGPVPSGPVEFRPYAERVLRAALEMKQ